MSIARRRASLEQNLDNCLLKFFYISKSKFKLRIQKIASKIYYWNKTNFYQNLLYDQFKICSFQLNKQNRTKKFLIVRFILKFKFFHIKKNTKKTQKNYELDFDQIHEKKIFNFGVINSIKCQLTQINFLIAKFQKKFIWKKNYNLISHCYSIFSTITLSKKINRVLEIGNIIKFIIYELNPEHLQVIFSGFFLLNYLFNLVEIWNINSITMILITIRDILFLVICNFDFFRRIKQKNIHLIELFKHFLEIIFLKVNFFYFIEQKLILKTNSLHMHFQIFELFFRFYNCVENFHNHQQKFEFKLKNFKTPLFNFKINEYISSIFRLLIGEKILRLAFIFNSKIFSQIYYEKNIKTNIMDKFHINLLFIFIKADLKHKFRDFENFFFKNYNFICKLCSLGINLNYTHPIFSFLLELLKEYKLLYIANIILEFLNQIFFSFVQSIDEKIISIHCKHMLLNNLKIKKSLMLCFNNKFYNKKKFFFEKRYFYFLNFSTYNFCEYTFKDFIYKFNFHNIFLNKCIQNRLYFQNLIGLTIKRIININNCKINTYKKNEDTSNFDFLKKKNLYLSKNSLFQNIITKMYTNLIIAFIKKKCRYWSVSFFTSNYFWRCLKILFLFYYKYTFLSLIFNFNFYGKFFLRKTRILFKTMYLNLVKIHLNCEKILKKKKILINQNFFSYYMCIYLIEKKKIKNYLLLNSFLLYILCFFVIANDLNCLPKHHINWNSMKKLLTFNDNIFDILNINHSGFLGMKYNSYAKNIYNKWILFTKPCYTPYFYVEQINYNKIKNFAEICFNNIRFNFRNANQILAIYYFIINISTIIWVRLFRKLREKFFAYFLNDDIFYLTTFRLDEGIFSYFNFDKKIRYVYDKIEDINKKIKNNLTKTRKTFTCVFFNSLQTKQLGIY